MAPRGATRHSGNGVPDTYHRNEQGIASSILNTISGPFEVLEVLNNSCAIQSMMKLRHVELEQETKRQRNNTNNTNKQTNTQNVNWEASEKWLHTMSHYKSQPSSKISLCQWKCSKIGRVVSCGLKTVEHEASERLKTMSKLSITHMTADLSLPHKSDVISNHFWWDQQWKDHQTTFWLSVIVGAIDLALWNLHIHDFAGKTWRQSQNQLQSRSSKSIFDAH